MLRLRSATARVIYLVVFGFLVFFAPYHFPVAPSVSISYLTGFSNRALFVLFATGALLYAALTRGEFGATQDPSAKDQGLGLPSLFLALTIALVACLISLFPFTHLPHGIEAGYAINRLEMLVGGHRPYLDFEFAYGPAHLYVPFLFVKILRLSPIEAYFSWWMLQWLVGTVMQWAVIRCLDFRLRYRTLIFWILFAFELTAIAPEGTAYTPIRSVSGATFLLLVVWILWRRLQLPYLTAAAGVLAAALGIAISPELGIGVAAGLFCWFVLLVSSPRSRFKLAALALYTLGIAALFVLCNRVGIFTTLKAFASGGYSYELLPNVPVMVILCAYLIAACVAVRDMLRRNFESMTIPFTAAGFAMLPAAMGRCDLGHLQIAAPAFLIGIAAIETAPLLRNWWRPLALATLAPPFLVSSAGSLRHELQRIRHAHPPLSDSARLSGCITPYRTPDIRPAPGETAQQDCLDTGYYADITNVLTPSAIQRKIEELDRRPRQPILLFDSPLSWQLPSLDNINFGPDGEGPSYFHPRQVHAPVTFDPIIDYIQQNYIPDPSPITAANGWRFRVWRPRNP